MSSHKLRLDLLPEPLALLRLPAEAAIPRWTSHARQFLSVTRTPTELSIVTDAAVVPKDAAAQGPYQAFRVQGPLPLNLIGIFASLAGPMAEAAIPILPIGTHDTDYLLVRTEDVARARAVLLAAGHQILSNR
jgi:hypothetical protein